jgi:phage terminase small subunit
MAGLNARQAAFVTEFLKCLNASEAARAAGYSVKTSGQIGERLLKNVEIAAAIAAGRKERAERTKIDADRVLRELASIAFLDVGTAFNADGSLKPVAEMDEGARRAISDMSETSNERGTARRIKFADKLRALDLLGRHLGLWDDKLTLKGDQQNPLTALIMSVQGSSIKPVEKEFG